MDESEADRQRLGQRQLAQREELESLRKEKDEVSREREKAKQLLASAGQDKQQLETSKQTLQEQLNGISLSFTFNSKLFNCSIVQLIDISSPNHMLVYYHKQV